MIDKNIFLPKGKLNRKYFFAFMVIVWIFMIIYFLLISYIYNINNFNELNLLYEQNRNLFNIPKVIYLYIVVCMISKRFRDLNWNVWISLLALLPGFDVLLSIICLLFKSKNKEKKSIKNQNIKSIDKPTKKISTIKLYTIIIFILVILIIILTAIIYRQEIRIKKIISPQEQSEYDYQSDFYMSGKNDSNKYNKLYENFACKENFICFIDEYGNNIFQINKKKYDYFGNFIEDRMFVANKIKTVDAIGLSIPTIVNISLLDSTGKVIKDFFSPVLIETDPEYTSANLMPEFYEGYARIDFIINNDIDRIKHVDDIHIEKKYINKNGEEIDINEIPKNIKKMLDKDSADFHIDRYKINENLIPKEMPCEYDTNNTCFAYIDKKGNIILKPKYSSDFIHACDSYTRNPNFYNGIAIVDSESGYRYIKTNGEYINDEAYDYAEPFYNKLAIVSKGNKFGYINTQGQWIIENIYINE